MMPEYFAYGKIYHPDIAIYTKSNTSIAKHMTDVMTKFATI